jgi:hypothetical protein
VTPTPPDASSSSDTAASTSGQGSESVSLGPGGRLLEETSRQLQRIVPFDAAVWFGTDPSTVLPTAPVRIENVPPGACEAYWNDEFRGQDVLLWCDLAESEVGGGTLYQATDGLPSRSRRYRDLLEPRGWGDELRATMRIGRGTWAVVDLFRSRSRTPFTARDVEQVTALGPELALSLADLATTGRRPHRQVEHDGPGTALFDAEGRMCSSDEQAERWLAELTGVLWGRPDEHPLLAPVWSLLSRAQTVAARQARGPATARLLPQAAAGWSCTRPASGQRRGGRS